LNFWLRDHRPIIGTAADILAVNQLVKEGEKAPDFTLCSNDEKDVSLSDYQRKKTVLYFYPKDGTAGCTQEAIGFRAYRHFGRKQRQRQIPPEVQTKTWIALHLAERPGRKSYESVWHLEREKTLRTNIHGNRTNCLPHQ
jgi:hypothetical protein